MSARTRDDSTARCNGAFPGTSGFVTSHPAPSNAVRAAWLLCSTARHAAVSPGGGNKERSFYALRKGPRHSSVIAERPF